MDKSKGPSVVAYFSMEISLHQDIPTYSGGLGVLAGDTLRSAADLSLPVVGVTLLYRKGYFSQSLDSAGNQSEAPVRWNPGDRLSRTDVSVTVEVEGRNVAVGAWRYFVSGSGGGEVPVYLLDTDLPENSDYDRTLTDTLYGGDNRYRLCQEVVLGIGGARVIEELRRSGEIGGGSSGGAGGPTVYHINEGHAALLTLHLLETVLSGGSGERDAKGDESGEDSGERNSWELTEEDLSRVRRQVAFTTHTPVPAGHDKFSMELTEHVLGSARTALLERVLNGSGYEFNVTVLALKLSGYVNAVSLRHRDVSREMFPDYRIDAITNGVHANTWTAPPFAELFDTHIPRWRTDNRYLRHAMGIPAAEIQEAHATCKRALLGEVLVRTGIRLRQDAFTIGFARRATPYKRADLIFSDPARLRAIARKHGPIQLIFAGKAHPHDEPGKELIRRIFRASGALAESVSVVYLSGYDLRLGALLTSGVDLWLNNPMRPLEASGTSGMKAALNGVPSLSVLDGWWIEGHIEGGTGWSIGEDSATDVDPSTDVHELYYKLDKVILPMFYSGRQDWTKVMRNAIAFNGSFFNTQRMLLQYMRNAYGMLDDADLVDDVREGAVLGR